MKKLLFILVFAIVFSPYLIAKDQPDTSGQSIVIKFKKGNSSDDTQRAPIYFNMDVLYYSETNTISISSEDVIAEVSLYHYGILVDYCSSIPTSFSLPYEKGLYTIEIVGDNWIAEGFLEL